MSSETATPTNRELRIMTPAQLALARAQQAPVNAGASDGTSEPPVATDVVTLSPNIAADSPLIELSDVLYGLPRFRFIMIGWAESDGPAKLCHIQPNVVVAMDMLHFVVHGCWLIGWLRRDAESEQQVDQSADEASRTVIDTINSGLSAVRRQDGLAYVLIWQIEGDYEVHIEFSAGLDEEQALERVAKEIGKEVVWILWPGVNPPVF